MPTNAHKSHSFPEAKVLLVDDRKENLTALESLLSSFGGLSIYKATSGREALELLLKHDFALALLDVQMPEINGFELAEYMRGSQKSSHIPIIFVTAGAIDARHTFKGYEAGAVDFLYKPLDPRIVRSKVQIFLELDHQKKLLARQLEETKKAKEMAEAANASKSQFLANMSHEIRTPLGAILGFAELMQSGLIDPKSSEEYLGIIIKNGHLLSRLIDDILDLAKVEAGRLEAEMTSLSLGELINDIVSLMAVRAQEKSLELRVVRSLNLPEWIESDPLRLRQILLNIIGNALKFTKQGSVTIDIDAKPVGADSYKIIFKVIDTGIGISLKQRNLLFQSFAQADSSTTRKYGGTGLGLHLSKKLAMILGGDVYLDPASSEAGSIFVVEITCRAGMAKSASKDSRPKVESEKSQDLKGAKVLVIEDSEDNQMLMGKLLASKGAVVEFASNGQEGVKRALGEEYDLILMDIQMPVMDGHEATRELRRQGFERPIIALSAHVMKEEIDKSLKAGCDQHLVKPIDATQLYKVMTELRTHH